MDRTNRVCMYITLVIVAMILALIFMLRGQGDPRI